MEWKKTRIVMNAWACGDFKIVENPEAAAPQRFKLESFSDLDAEPEFFGSLKQAQTAAALRNELDLAHQEIQRLRHERDMDKQADAFERSQRPIETPLVAAIAAELIEAMPQDDGRGIPGRNGTANGYHDAGPDESPF